MKYSAKGKSGLRRIGILGGSFNPIHFGHLVLAEQTRELLDLDKVIFVPTNLTPHKRTTIPAQKRYRMVELALRPHPCFEISDLEILRGGVSYSVETVRQLQSIFPRARLFFIVGSDFLKEFSTWKDVVKIGKICRFVIAARPGFPVKKTPANMQATKINITAVDISSTDIRNRVKKGRSIRYLVPEEVRKYILKKRLYRAKIKNT